MQSRQPAIFVKYVNAAWSGDPDASFQEKLKAYQNRPFDDMKKVMTKMKPVDEAVFSAHWDAQVQALKEFEASLSIHFPLDRDTLKTILPVLESKLSELVSLLNDELVDQLSHEGANNADTQGYVETMARAYAFHLLTKSKIVGAEHSVASVKIHQEFNRLLRKSIFRGDIVNHFYDALNEAFSDKSSLNETKLGLYASIFGVMAEQAYLHGIEDNLDKLEAMELDSIRKTLPLLKDDAVKSEINALVDGVWEARWDIYAREQISNTNVRLSANLVNVLNGGQYQLGDAVKRNILLQLCKLAYEGKFDEASTGDRTYQFRDAFIQKIVDSLAGVSPALKDEVMGELKSRFHDFKDKKIQAAIGATTSRSVKGLFASAAEKTAAAAVSLTSGRTPKK